MLHFKSFFNKNIFSYIKYTTEKLYYFIIIFNTSHCTAGSLGSNPYFMTLVAYRRNALENHDMMFLSNRSTSESLLDHADMIGFLCTKIIRIQSFLNK